MGFLAHILIWALKSKSAKLGTVGIAGGSGIVALLMNLHTDITTRIDVAKSEVKAYVDVKNDFMQRDMSYIKESQSEIKDLLKLIDKRIYDLKINSETN